MTAVPATQRLPEIPKVANWAATLLVMSAIPWLIVFTDNVFSVPVIALSAEFPARSHEPMLLLNIGYLMLAVSILNGYRWTRIAIVIVTISFQFVILIILSSTAGLGHSGESEVNIGSFELTMFAWTVILSNVGLMLLYTPASSTYIAQSEAYQDHLDRQNVEGSLR